MHSLPPTGSDSMICSFEVQQAGRAFGHLNSIREAPVTSCANQLCWPNYPTPQPPSVGKVPQTASLLPLKRQNEEADAQ